MISKTVKVSTAMLENTWMFLRNLKQNSHMIQQPCFCVYPKELKLVCGRKTTLVSIAANKNAEVAEEWRDNTIHTMGYLLTTQS